MKKNLLFVFTMLCALSFFTACSDDDNSEPEVPVLLKGVTDYKSENLQLTYGGSVMPGKVVSFSTTDGKTASLSMQGTLDLSALMPTKTSPLVNLAPGVIPGETTTVIDNIVLTQVGNKYTFEGSDSNNGREIAYSGEVDSTSLKLNLDVKFPKNDLQGTWNLTPLKIEADGSYSAEPVYAVWDADKKFDVFIPLDPQVLMTLALRMEILGGASVEQLLMGVLQDVTFKEDGNIVATYSEGSNIQNPQWTSSPLNIAQYKVDNNKVLVFLNIDMVLANIRTKASIADLPASVLEGIMANVVPMLSQGIPLAYRLNEGKLTVYTDTELIMKLMQVFLPLLQDENIINMIMESIKKDPSFGSMAPMVQGMLEQLPAVLASTETLELGLNLEK